MVVRSQLSFETMGPLEVLRYASKARNQEVGQEGVQFAVVMLHGYGADARDLYPIGEVWQLPAVDFFFPNAPIGLSLLPGRAWFNLNVNALVAYASGLLKPKDPQNVWADIGIEVEELLSAQRKIEALLKVLPVAPERVFVGGFSQGATMAALLALAAPRPLAGLLVFSGILLGVPTTAAGSAPRQNRTPFFQVHGSDDPLLPVFGARDLEKHLHQAGMPGKLECFSGGHEIPAEVLLQAKAWLQKHCEENAVKKVL